MPLEVTTATVESSGAAVGYNQRLLGLEGSAQPGLGVDGVWGHLPGPICLSPIFTSSRTTSTTRMSSGGRRDWRGVAGARADLRQPLGPLLLREERPLSGRLCKERSGRDGHNHDGDSAEVGEQQATSGERDKETRDGDDSPRRAAPRHTPAPAAASTAAAHSYIVVRRT